MSDGDSGFAGFALGVILTGFVMLILCDRIVTPDEISRAEKICENANTELAWFETNFAEIEVICKSGATFIIKTDSSVQFDTTVKAEPTNSEVNQK